MNNRTMSITPTGNTRTRHTQRHLLATQVASHPRLEAAVMKAIRDVLPSVVDSVLRETYGGETFRSYAPRGPSQLDKVERNRRIKALAAPPSSLTPHAIAALEGVGVRRVQQILAERDQ